MLLKDVSMDMTYSQSFKESGPSAYERLILDALLGDSILFYKLQRSRPLLANFGPRTSILE